MKTEEEIQKTIDRLETAIAEDKIDSKHGKMVAECWLYALGWVMQDEFKIPKEHPKWP